MVGLYSVIILSENYGGIIQCHYFIWKLWWTYTVSLFYLKTMVELYSVIILSENCNGLIQCHYFIWELWWTYTVSSFYLKTVVDLYRVIILSENYGLPLSLGSFIILTLPDHVTAYTRDVVAGSDNP